MKAVGRWRTVWRITGSLLETYRVLVSRMDFRKASGGPRVPVAFYGARVLFAVALLVVATLGVGGCGARLVSDGLPVEEETGREVIVARVTDGDTVEVRPAIGGVDDVRLIGVDAPEAYGPSGPQPYAAEATDFAEGALEGRRVELEFDVERTDDYGRVLAYVYGPDGAMFNEELLLGGYAQVATFPPNTRYVGRFEAAQEKARESGRGIWGLDGAQSCRLADRGNGIGGGCRGERFTRDLPG